MANMKDFRAVIKCIRASNPGSPPTIREERVIDFLEREITRRELEAATRRRARHTGRGKGQCRNEIRAELGMRIP